MTKTKEVDILRDVCDTRWTFGLLLEDSPASSCAISPAPIEVIWALPSKKSYPWHRIQEKQRLARIDHRASFTPQSDQIATWRVHNPDLEDRVVKAPFDKQQIGERRQVQTGNGLFDFSNLGENNFPGQLSETREVARLEDEKSRGSGHSDSVDTDKATITLHPRHLEVYTHSLG